MVSTSVVVAGGVAAVAARPKLASRVRGGRRRVPPSKLYLPCWLQRLSSGSLQWLRVSGRTDEITEAPDNASTSSTISKTMSANNHSPSTPSKLYFPC